MWVTCITITRAARAAVLQDAVRDFLRQTYAPRELLILHDGDARDHQLLQALLRQLGADRSDWPVRLERARAPGPLGQLRNEALALSQGELFCQWDDDDRYHPERLALQCAPLRAQQADFCVLSDQLHWFQDQGLLSWDDWDVEPYPMNFVQGTLTGRRALMPAYPGLARGEDTALCLALLAAGHRIARLRDCGWCYIYRYHGANVWSQQHHLAIAQAKQLSEFRLRARRHALRQRLAQYDAGFEALALWHRAGTLSLT